MKISAISVERKRMSEEKVNGQLLVVYDTDDQVVVYTTVYIAEQGKQAVKDCTRRYGIDANPRIVDRP